MVSNVASLSSGCLMTITVSHLRLTVCGSWFQLKCEGLWSPRGRYVRTAVSAGTGREADLHQLCLERVFCFIYVSCPPSFFAIQRCRCFCGHAFNIPSLFFILPGAYNGLTNDFTYFDFPNGQSELNKILVWKWNLQVQLLWLWSPLG